jgi:hypothetical protein
MVRIVDMRDLLGLHPSDEQLSRYITSLTTQVSSTDADMLQVKSYPDSVYFNYPLLGLSLLFQPQNAYKPKGGLKKEELENENLVLGSIDIYNVKPATRISSNRASERAFATHPVSPINLSLLSMEGKARPPFAVTVETTGKTFVECLGEPNRKGGGAGPSSGSIGIWCEWSKHGIMVEFGGEEARGLQAWERGKDAVWKIITIFPASSR